MNRQINHPARSKINATAAVIAIVNFAAALGYIPEDKVADSLVVVNTFGPLLIVVLWTWFTGPET